jgi:hypothetical protein
VPEVEFTAVSSVAVRRRPDCVMTSGPASHALTLDDAAVG